MTAKLEKETIAKKFGNEITNTGAPEVQVALFTARINELTGHLQSHKKDYSTQRSLLRLVGKRRRLLDYLKDTRLEKYREVIKELNIRK